MNKYLIVILLFCESCFWNDSHHQKIISDFEVGWVNSPICNNIYYKSQGIFKECVFAVGKDDKFIIVKTHPLDNIEAETEIKRTTNFYIIEIEKYKEDPTQSLSRGIFGPYTYGGFINQKSKLNISKDINFTLIF